MGKTQVHITVISDNDILIKNTNASFVYNNIGENWGGPWRDSFLSDLSRVIPI